LGHQKETNYALQTNLTKEQFIREVLDGLMPPPSYFPKNVLLNILGYDSIENVLKKGLTQFSPAAFQIAAEESNAVIIDTRTAQDFAKAFIPGSVNIGIDGSFATWVGTLIVDIEQPILFIADVGREEEVVTRFARVGYDKTMGYLNGGIQAWKEDNKPVEKIESISGIQLSNLLHLDIELVILDVRKASEYDSQHIENAINAPLDYINDSMMLIDKSKTYYVYCAAGYRSMIFISILKARGYDNLIDVQGGFFALLESDKFKVTNYVCPSTLL
jgi:rhodanese-related sulfurtransferase